ncbi:PH domain-containing protein [Nonomuraea typhae]|uniref:PH domain-containing protein n=1 Tax=Nonomuraea typhae TaxID=2603600 RepID=UPI0012FBC65A|nr:PH domain-containing protein [Nonomuraea typhae]
MTTELRLSPRLLLVNLSMLAGPLALFTLTVAFTGAGLQAIITLGSLVVTFLVITGIGTMRLLTTRFRITGERAELRSGLLFRTRSSVPLDRIRGVERHTKPLHRLFGLTSLRISATSRELSLDGITARQADDLRRLLWERRTAVAPAADPTIAELNWAWLRYAPLTVWGVGSVFIGAGTAYRILREMKIDPLAWEFFRNLFDPPWFGTLVTVAAVLLSGLAISFVTFVDAWAGFRLERENGLFRVRRGLLVTRSVTMEAQRVRGVEVTEPMLLRRAGGARLNAIATGLGDSEENRSRRPLTPPVPRAEALRVAAEVLATPYPNPALGTRPRATPDSPVETPLGAHPRVALRRRITRGLLVLAGIAVVPLGLGLWLTPVLVHVAWVIALAGLPVVLLLAGDAYRALGHAVHGRFLVVRAGTFVRRTAALGREGVIGWTVTRSPFQRRNDLLTIAATTAAGDGAYKVRDVAVRDGLEVAEAAVPGLLAPFTERAVSRGGTPGGR